MKILFYSKHCKHCNTLFSYKENHSDFINIKKICVDNTQIPPQITKVPTLVSSDLIAPITGKEVFAYFNCLEMFYQKTNNINYWKNKIIKRPIVDNFIPGKEKPILYQEINVQSNKNSDSLNNKLNSYKQKR